MEVVVSGPRIGNCVQDRYVPRCFVGKCPIHKNILDVVQLFVKVHCSYLIQFLSMVRFLSGRISFPTLLIYFILLLLLLLVVVVVVGRCCCCCCFEGVFVF